MIRVFNRHGNRENKNKARLKFVMRERGFDWLRDAIEEEYQRHSGATAASRCRRKSPRASVVFSRSHHRKGAGELLPVFEPASPEFREWRETNVRAAEAGRLRRSSRSTVPQGNLTGEQMRGLARLREQAGDGSLRFTMNQNVVLAWVPAGALSSAFTAR